MVASGPADLRDHSCESHWLKPGGVLYGAAKHQDCDARWRSFARTWQHNTLTVKTQQIRPFLQCCHAAFDVVVQTQP
jgi:hypothetical protein